MKQLFIVLLLIPVVLSAQFSDDFNDGDFTQNPVWSGTTNKFIVNTSFQLQLNDTEASTAWLSSPYSISGDIEWKFWIKLAFSPSGSNYSNVFLVSDKENLTEELNGYYLRFGEAGSLDAIELFKIQNGISTSICRGTEGLLANSFALQVKVVKKADGNWKVYADPSNSGVYQLETSGFDNSFQAGGFFGILCQYTVSNATKVYFDNIVIGIEEVDNQPPVLMSTTATDPFNLMLTFNEAISSASATNTGNYQVNEGVGFPQLAAFGPNATKVLLSFELAFELAKVYELTVQDIEDLEGNILPSQSMLFSYYEAQPNDIVINEIMADPSPVVGLPDWEYVELYNTTDLSVDLSGWVLFSGTTERLFNQVVIPPKQYLILANEEARSSFENLGLFYGFSTFQLTNSGQELKLVSNQGQNISYVSYSDSWYGDQAKVEGGWSLEQINPENPCGGSGNWTSSKDMSGGTPGLVNSVYDTLSQLPKPERIKLQGNNILQLWFDQLMDVVSMSDVNAYLVQPGSIKAVQAFVNPADQRFIELIFELDFQPGIVYQLNIATTVLNCAGKAVAAGTQISFGIPEQADMNDLVINEILFNPLDNGVDYVEIYNRSGKIIDLEQIWLAAIRNSPPNQPDTTLKTITENSLFMLPEQYRLLTTSATKVKQQYFTPDPASFVELPSFPTYSNAEGTAMLKSKAGIVIDVMTYNEKMHFPLLSSVKGVSLERVAFDRPSDDLTNWHSASETAGFGTPGYVNSIFTKVAESTGELTIDPEIFSPDGDGKADLTSIAFQFDQPGYVLNMTIFDASGQTIRHLVKSKLVEQSGSVSWDGLNESGNRVGVGIYLVFAEVFDLSGNVERFKKAVVVATR